MIKYNVFFWNKKFSVSEKIYNYFNKIKNKEPMYSKLFYKLEKWNLK